MSLHYGKVREKWRILKATSGFKNAMLFLVFVIVSTVFWFILALNDNAQSFFNVRIQITNKPDSVTFISDVPERIHVAVSDKGTHLWRNGFLKKPVININFSDYASDGTLRFSHSDLQSALKETFGGTSEVSAFSIDSLQLTYTTLPGKVVPVYVNCQVIPASGSTLTGSVKATPGSVKIYGNKEFIDTVHFVVTDNLILRDVNETTVKEVKIKKIEGARTIPDEVVLTAMIEPLVRKEAMITVDAVNVPDSLQLLLFPSKVPVEYYVAMSLIGNDEDSNIELLVDYDDINKSDTGKLKIETGKFPDRLKNLRLSTDSVEYAIIHQ